MTRSIGCNREAQKRPWYRWVATFVPQNNSSECSCSFKKLVEDI